MPANFESGLRSHRIEFVREDTEGEAPTDPAWNRYSDTVRQFEWAPSASHEPQYGLGDASPNAVHTGMEEHELTILYDFQQWLVDGSGNAQDAAYDAFVRDEDQMIPNSHTIVSRETKQQIKSENTHADNGRKDTRLYTVLKGATVDEVTITNDPSGAERSQIELSYLAEKGRKYQIDQPGSATGLAVASTDAADDTQSVTVEGEDGSGNAVSETVALNGTTLVEITTTFAEIDAVGLDAETVGNVELYIDEDGTSGAITQGDLLTVIPGSSAYEHESEGDLGVPLLGAGSHAGEIGTSYEMAIGKLHERPAGQELADNVASTEFTVSNNLDPGEQTLSQRPVLSAGVQEIEADCAVWGEQASYDYARELLENNAANFRMVFSQGNIQMDNTHITESGLAKESEQVRAELGLTLMGEGITVDA